MSVPNEPDYALIKMGDGAGPEVFTAVCGIESVSINKTAQTSERTRRDCTNLAAPGVRRLKTTGKTLTVSGNGGVDKANIAKFETALGVVGNYKVELYKIVAGAGVLFGTYSGAFMLTADNLTADANGDSAGEITLENDGLWTWVAAV